MASIRDVARIAGVGATTVSRYINGNGYVSQNARERITKAMEELDYTPNELARNLFHKKTGIVAILVPDVSHPFFGEFVKCAESDLYDLGYKTMVCNTVKACNYEHEYLDMLRRHIVDGIISGVHSLDVESYAKIKNPIVALDRYLGKHIPVVGVNHEKGGEMAAYALLKSGCTKVLQFQGSLVVNTPSHARHSAFKKIMEAHAIPVVSYELAWNRFDMEYFSEVVKTLFDQNPDVDGFFGVDLLALACLNEAKRRGLQVPDDIHIVAYDGTYITRVVSPSITAVVQPIDQLAKLSTEMVCNLIDGKEYSNTHIVLEPTLFEGETTSKVKTVSDAE